MLCCVVGSIIPTLGRRVLPTSSGSSRRFTLKMNIIDPLETSGTICSKERKISEDLNPSQHRCENLNLATQVRTSTFPQNFVILIDNHSEK